MREGRGGFDVEEFCFAILDCSYNGRSSSCFLEAFFKKLNQSGKVPIVGVFHGSDIVVTHLIALGHGLDLRLGTN